MGDGGAIDLYSMFYYPSTVIASEAKQSPRSERRLFPGLLFRPCWARHFSLLAQRKVPKRKGTPTAGFPRGQTREAALTPWKLPCAPRPFARSPDSQFARCVGYAAAPLEQLEQEARFIAKRLRCSAAPTGLESQNPKTTTGRRLRRRLVACIRRMGEAKCDPSCSRNNDGLRQTFIHPTCLKLC